MNKDYQDYSIEDFVCDDDFRYWVLTPDAESNLYWENWQFRNPGKKNILEKAADIVRSLKSDAPDSGRIDKMAPVSEMFERVKEGGEYRSFKRLRPAFLWAATASLVVILGALFVMKNNEGLPKTASRNIVDSLVAIYNSTDSSRIVTLPDSTKVSLDKNSCIQINSLFYQSKERKVFLTGNAFFDVAKDKTRPFYVYTGSITIKVVGTSFKVRSNKEKEKISVDVLSGVVKVSSITEKGNTKRLEEIVLTRNQKVVIDKNKGLNVGIVDNPVISENEFVRFNYDEKPVHAIFADLEKGYGVRIQYDNTKIYDKLFSGNIEGESLTEKLFIICKTLGYKYNVSDGNIIVSLDGDSH